jgi:hypothetical protein
MPSVDLVVWEPQSGAGLSAAEQLHRDAGGAVPPEMVIAASARHDLGSSALRGIPSLHVHCGELKKAEEKRAE